MHCRALHHRFASPSVATAALILSTTFAGAQPASTAAVPARFAPLPGANVISVVANDYMFEMPASVPAGLTTMRFTNKGKEFHHLYLVKVEKGKKV